MGDRSNEFLNEQIEHLIDIWYGTSFGVIIKNMYENGSDYEDICEVAGIEM